MYWLKSIMLKNMYVNIVSNNNSMISKASRAVRFIAYYIGYK